MNDRIATAINRLASEHVEVAAEAMAVLRERPEEAYGPVLAALAENRSSPSNLVRLLGEWGRAESVAVLREAAEQGAYPFRYHALLALAEHGAPEADAALVDLAASSDPELARLAALVQQQ